MAPDVPYSMPLGISRELTHSWVGVPTVDLPIAVVLVVVWYAALRAPMVDLAPARLRARMPELGTVAGLAILAVWAARWVRTTRPDAARRSWASQRGRTVAWVAVAGVFVGTGLVVWTTSIADGRPPFDPNAVFRAVTAAGGVAGLTALVSCVIWWIARRDRRSRVDLRRF